MAIPTNNKLQSANFGLERQLADSKKKRQENLMNFQTASRSPESFKAYASQQEGRSTAPSGQVQGSFDRMMNIGQVGGLGGRMGELEKASMRLAEAASQRRIGEMEKEQQVKTAGIGQTAKVSEKADLESRLRQLQSRRPNLLFSQEGQSWQDEIKRLEDQIRSLG
jgi:hypothetical protein